MPRSARMPLLGKTKPRLFSAPLVTGPPGPCGCGCALSPETSKGFSAVDFAETVLGVELFPWQRWLLIHALELRPDGKYRFRTVLILVGRQNGKTSLIEIKNLWKMFVEGVSLVVSVAQELDVAEESWDNAVAIVEGIPELNAEKTLVKEGNGKKTLKLSNGSRWKPKAAGRRPGRGLSGDDVNLDELREHQTWAAWAAVSKTTLARPNPQIWAFSNAGDDKSIVLNTLRTTALAAIEDPAAFADLQELFGLTADSFGIFEWSAPDDIKCTCIEKGPGRPHDVQCRLWDREAWAQANPSVGYIEAMEEGIAAALLTDPEEVFRTEVLCQRVPVLVPPKIPVAQWVSCSDPESQIVSGVVLTWDVSWTRNHGAICVAGYRSDGTPQVEMIEYRPGTDWLPRRFAEIADRQPVSAVVYDPAAPSASLLPDVNKAIKAWLGLRQDHLLPAHLDPKALTLREVTQACGRLYDTTKAKTVRHLGDERLLKMLRESAWRSLSDTWAWDRKAAKGDICGLVGVTNVLEGLELYGQRPAPPAAPAMVTAPTSSRHPLAMAGF